MARAAEMQHRVYQQNRLKRDFINEKERYAKYLEQGSINYTVPINLTESVDLNQIRRVPLGKIVTQMEMTNPNARKHLKQMLEC